jgi:cellulose biosynthesis protein BcsQ
MIVTIVHAAPPAAGAQLAENLALLRARHGRRVLLLDASPERMCERWGADRAHSRLRPVVHTRSARGPGFSEEVERLLARHDDIVVDAGDGNGAECRGALIAAQVVLVPLAPEHADIDVRYRLIARLNNARMFNPGLRVLFVTAGGEQDPAPQALAALRAYAAQVMSAGVAGTVLHLPALLWGADLPGRCACDFESSAGAAEMAALYEEVYRASSAASPAWRSASPFPVHAAGGLSLKK